MEFVYELPEEMRKGTERRVKSDDLPMIHRPTTGRGAARCKRAHGCTFLTVTVPAISIMYYTFSMGEGLTKTGGLKCFRIR